ncbi:LPS-assembly protein LptD [Kingella sp. SNUBH-2017]|uniref:LPS-assembly protein LptD n=1 Tax=Kingella pumchi TaxID=2779506 RepID=A0ABS9NP69_9NEIS|nr:MULTISPECIES: LPS-assembly protein LptD [Kingella]MCG6504585.1 LPS-assembly protein LptD [Kingella pumchi]MDD2182686.1 LPS-assembly protein LptD [Kingella sp. SNUBH-2017]
MILPRLSAHTPLVLALGAVFSTAAAAEGTATAADGWSRSDLSCRAGAQSGDDLPPAKGSGGAVLPENATRISADRIAGQTNVRARAEGDVIIERNDQTLNADWVDYDQQADVVRAGDSFTLTRGDGQTVRGKELHYDLSRESGRTADAQFAVEHESRRLQGVSAEMEMRDKNHYAMRGVKFNTCNPGDRSWYIQAAELKADRESGIGTARHARLVFGGVPVLYTPWADFPLNGNRKSGLLVPTIKIGSDGTELELPYYFNLAPNYDATLAPGIITARGATLGGEFRYLQDKYSGSLKAKYLPHDRRSPHRHRYEAEFAHLHRFNTDLSGGIDYRQVSDDDYYRDFYGRNEIAENVHLNRSAWLDYRRDLFGQPVQMRLSVQRYQTLSDAQGRKQRPYAILPRFSAAWQKNFGLGQFNIDTQFTRFEHSELQSGSRLVIYPSWQWDFSRPWGYVRPKIGVHATRYWLKGKDGYESRTLSRVLPLTNVDAGLAFERKTTLFGKSYLQTLEPRAFYNYIPSKSQNDLPNFDTSLNGFSYAQLFRENSYSGQDRINASNSLSVGLQSRLIDAATGAERFRAGIGRKYYFRDDNVLLDGSIEHGRRWRSDIAAFAGGRIGDNWHADLSWHYNESAKATQRFDIGASYNPEPGKVISARFKYGAREEIYTGFYGKLKHIDFAAQWPINERLYAIGRFNYSLSPHTPLEQMAGLEYKSACGCWSVSVVGQRYVNGLNSRKNAFFVTLQLKDLSSLGKDPYEQLRLAIPGYSKTNEVNRK